jgi:hypothetical protein
LEDETTAEAASLGALASRFVETESVRGSRPHRENKIKVIYHDPATDMLTILARLSPIYDWLKRNVTARGLGCGTDN